MRVLEMMGDPHLGYPIIHVAGTNGKTSVTHMAAAVVGAHGLAAGRFTSPHLIEPRERFAIGSVMSEEDFVQAVADVTAFSDLHEAGGGDGVTYFELTTLMALAWFAERAVDVAVLETGLGGRLDATNLGSAEVSVVTSIGMDHTDYLGDTIEAIAAEKLAILPEGGRLVTGPLPDRAASLASERAGEAGAVWAAYGRDFSVDGDTEFDLSGVYATYEDLTLAAEGPHQRINFAVAVAAVELWLGRALDPDAVAEAAMTVKVPGRLESAGSVLLDGAHNPDGTATLAEALRSTGQRFGLVFGVLGDRDVTAMLRSLAPFVEHLYATAADSDRAQNADAIAAAAAEVLDVPIDTHSTVASALDAAVAAGKPVLVAGSLYVVGEARAHLGLTPA